MTDKDDEIKKRWQSPDEWSEGSCGPIRPKDDLNKKGFNEMDKEFVFAGQIYPYREEIEDDGYHYEISAEWKGAQAWIEVFDFGVHVELEDPKGQGEVKEYLMFDIIPSKIFKNKSKLEPDDLIEILKTIMNIGINESKSHKVSAAVMNKCYKYWKTEVRDKEK